ncbi:MAG TPA: SCO family protein [Opitutaceae bacterium]|nr:SCO family protein [Opitutaceae bacterium]
MLSACSKKADTAPKVKHYELTGEVLSVDTAKNMLTIRHDEIVGLMPAMTMEFSVSPGDAANAKVGQHLKADLVPDGKGDFRLEKIWVDDAAKRSAVEAAAKALLQDTVARGNEAYREVGENAPEFTLYDQEGQVVDSSRFRGKQVMINFIFTRCPVASMCPASVARFQQTQRLAREAGVKNLQLLSITLDPTYDTPGILKTYTLARGIDTSNYAFLTGPENAIKSLLSQFGVLAYFDGPLLNHTLATLLIDEQGRIIHREDGSKWEPATFISKMKKG